MVALKKSKSNIESLASRYARLRRLADRVRRRGTRTAGALALVTAERRAATALLDAIADAFGPEDIIERPLRDDLLGGFA